MKCIFKIIKRQRLLAKYARTDEKMEKDLHLLNMFRNNEKASHFFIHRIYCELRCYNRLKGIKNK